MIITLVTLLTIPPFSKRQDLRLTYDLSCVVTYRFPPVVFDAHIHVRQSTEPVCASLGHSYCSSTLLHLSHAVVAAVSGQVQ